MINKDVLKAATEFANYLSTFEFVDEVLLVGSHVTGNVHSKSDIDICILCDGFDYTAHNEEWTIKKREYNSEIQIIPVTKELEVNMNYYYENKQSSVLLYKRK